jgi:hypothetical protein
MTPLKYFGLNGERAVIDIESLVDVVRGPSGKQPGWRALITYSPEQKKFLELRDAPPDVRGNSRSETEEVTESYVQGTFGLSTTQIAQMISQPKLWVLVEK